MVTFRLDFHIGRVECVTCHVPESQYVVGGVKAGWGRPEVLGGRTAIAAAIVPDSRWMYNNGVLPRSSRITLSQ